MKEEILKQDTLLYHQMDRMGRSFGGDHNKTTNSNASDKTDVTNNNTFFQRMLKAFKVAMKYTEETYNHKVISAYSVDTLEMKNSENRGTNSYSYSLITPILHHICKYTNSNLLDRVNRFYQGRWALSYPLQKRLPFKKWPCFGLETLTYGEVLLVLPYIILLAYGIVTSFIPGCQNIFISGRIARFPLILTFVTASHNSLVSLLIGIPFERALVYHKLSGRFALLLGLFHGIGALSMSEKSYNKSYLFKGQTNVSGSTLTLCITLILLSSMKIIRRRFFEVFYYSHIAISIGCVVCAFYHSGLVVPVLVSLFYGADVLLRFVYMANIRHPKTASIRRISNNVIELSFPKTSDFDYNPGQFILLCVPCISLFQWHPFSISSSPQQDEVSFHIRVCGDWTTQLWNKTVNRGSGRRNIDILFEGPYGSLSIDLNRYEMFLIFCGGIGVTPMQSICTHLVHEHNTKVRNMKKIWFVWSSRDPILQDKMDVSASVLKNQEERENEDQQQYEDLCSEMSRRYIAVEDIANNILSDLPQSFTPDSMLESDMSWVHLIHDDGPESSFLDDLKGVISEVKSGSFSKQLCSHSTDKSKIIEMVEQNCILAPSFQENGNDIEQGRCNYRKIVNHTSIDTYHDIAVQDTANLPWDSKFSLSVEGSFKLPEEGNRYGYHDPLEHDICKSFEALGMKRSSQKKCHNSDDSTVSGIGASKAGLNVTSGYEKQEERQFYPLQLSKNRIHSTSTRRTENMDDESDVDTSISASLDSVGLGEDSLFSKIPRFNTQQHRGFDESGWDLNDRGSVQCIKEILHLDFYLTKSNEEVNRHTKQKNQDSSNKWDTKFTKGYWGGPNVTFGRPDITQIFHEMRKKALLENQKRVAVCVCAPGPMIKACKEACVLFSGRGVQFDCHCECLEF